MKLIVEQVNDVEYLVETEGDKKVHKIRGIFLQSEVKNRNGRIYPKSVVEREVKLYQDKIKAKRSVGMLGHPPTPETDLKTVSHLVESLQMQGNDAVGLAKVLDTPTGRIVETLLDSGVQLGVSSRGLGSVNKQNFVENNYKMIAIDLVSEPSGPEAFVEGILENKEYVIDGDKIVEVAFNEIKRKLDMNGKRAVRLALKNFLARVRNNQ